MAIKSNLIAYSVFLMSVIWCSEVASALEIAQAHRGSFHFAKYSADGESLYVAKFRSVQKRKVSDFSIIWESKVPFAYMMVEAIESPDQKTVFIGCGRFHGNGSIGSLVELNVETGEKLRERTFESSVNCLMLAGDNLLIGTGHYGSPGAVHVLETKTWRIWHKAAAPGIVTMFRRDYGEYLIFVSTEMTSPDTVSGLHRFSEGRLIPTKTQYPSATSFALYDGGKKIRTIGGSGIIEEMNDKSGVITAFTRASFFQDFSGFGVIWGLG